MSDLDTDDTSSRRPDWTVWLTIVMGVVFAWSLFRTCAPQRGYVDGGSAESRFDATAWRAEPERRAAMADDLIAHIEASDYTRDELVAILGEASRRGADEIVWHMGECGRGMPTYCYLTVEFGPDGKIARAYETRD